MDASYRPNEPIRRFTQKPIHRINFLVPPIQGDSPDLPPPRYKRTKRWVIFFLFFIILTVGGLWHVFTKPDTENPPVDSITLEQKPVGLLGRIKQFVFSKDVTLEGEKSDRINILLLGMGGLGHDGPFLTDTIIIASIKPTTGQVALISIPRDLGVNIPDHGWQKINNINSIAEVKKRGSGGEYARHVVGETFDVPLQYYARIDFHAFKDIIDEVGGIKINVERSFVDNEYPTENYRTTTVSFAKGIQEMNGERALQYARSRHGNNGEGSDFARAHRQQKMLLALKEKLISFSTLANPIRLNNITKTLDSHFTTNMSSDEMVAFVKLARDLQLNSIQTLVLDSSPNGYLQNGFSPDGAFILEPKTGSFDSIQYAIQNIFDVIPPAADDTPAQEAPRFPGANIEVQNGTWQAGLAARIGKELTDKHLTVTKVGNTIHRPLKESGIYLMKPTAPAEVVDAVKTTLSLPVRTSPPPDEKTEPDTDILIILGQDFSPLP